MPTYNPAGVDLAVAALAQIEMHPETWNQDDWRCKTGFCLAGWMAELSPEVEWGARGPLLTNGSHVAAWANAQIGGHPWEQGLFHGGNTIEDLRAGVKALCNGEWVSDAIETERAERVS